MALARELAILSTSLPPGVFPRADEERIDVIKCFLSGPADSPCAYGIYERDIFRPLREYIVLLLHHIFLPLRQSTPPSSAEERELD